MYQSMKTNVKRVLGKQKCIDSVEFVEMTAEEIQKQVDYEYRGGDRIGNNEVLVVYYKPELYAAPRYVLDWAWVRPDELANELEI